MNFGQNMEERICIAVYLRLSKADERSARVTKEESGSISMQRILIQRYIESHFKAYQIKEYKDDGFSGTNFNRPGVQKLLEDVRNGEVNCIVVKDFSRFGRDYVETGAYIEQIFPFLGVRFISVNDEYDSGDYKGAPVNLSANFRNLLYDLYSKDLSRKVKTSLQVKKEQGNYVSANPPFGYEKAPGDRHMLVVCEEEAKVVRLIFALSLQGMSVSQIAGKLNCENIPTPVEFKIEKGSTCRMPKGDRFYWNSSKVSAILRNQVYTGDIEYGKTEKKQVGGPKVSKARTEWKTVRGHHAAVIRRADFEAAQKKRAGKTKRQRSKVSRHPFVGKAVCGCCKRNLQFKETLNPYFTCCTRYTMDLAGCVKKVNVMFLEQVVLFELAGHLKEWNLAEELFLLQGNEVTEDMVERYIDKITVYEGDKIDIKWKLVNGKPQ